MIVKHGSITKPINQVNEVPTTILIGRKEQTCTSPGKKYDLTCSILRGASAWGWKRGESLSLVSERSVGRVESQTFTIDSDPVARKGKTEEGLKTLGSRSVCAPRWISYDRSVSEDSGLKSSMMFFVIARTLLGLLALLKSHSWSSCARRGVSLPVEPLTPTRVGVHNPRGCLTAVLVGLKMGGGGASFG